jgi:hypothetical protein
MFYWFLIIVVLVLFGVCVAMLAANVLGRCEGGEIEAQMFKLVQMFNRIPSLKNSTEAPLLQNPC